MTVTHVSKSPALGAQPAWCKVLWVWWCPMRPRTCRPADRGFTLFELLIVMGIMAIFAAIAIPSYRFVTSSNRVAAEVNGLLGDLQFARAEAIKEGQSVAVCVATANYTQCDTSGTAPANWQNGWIVFGDTNSNGQVDTGEVIYRVQAQFTGSDSLSANETISAITFNREGFASANGGGLGAGDGLMTLHSSPVAQQTTRCLSLSTIGLMAVQTYGSPCL
jgi:type IV fimbrial biogenesis protein FimT